jgi:hypothetical protein
VQASQEVARERKVPPLYHKELLLGSPELLPCWRNLTHIPGTSLPAAHRWQTSKHELRSLRDAYAENEQPSLNANYNYDPVVITSYSLIKEL